MMRILLYEDNTELRESLSILLRGVGRFTVVGAFENCVNVEQHLRELHPEFVLMDIEMPQVDGLQGLRRIKKIQPNLPVMILTVFEDDSHVFEAVCQGAT